VRAAEIAQYLQPSLPRMSGEHKSTGAVDYTGDETGIPKYSHREMARRFAAILDSLSE